VRPYDVIRVRLGDDTYERYLRPLLADPEPEILDDADIDMRTAEHEAKRWWLAVKGGQVLAFCALWPDPDRPRWVSDQWIAGHNYERRGPGRHLQAYTAVFHARQGLISRRRYRCRTWIFDEPVGLHIAAGWRRAKTHYDPADVSERNPEHHWQELYWEPGFGRRVH
jgi:hypothetical protein